MTDKQYPKKGELSVYAEKLMDNGTTLTEEFLRKMRADGVNVLMPDGSILNTEESLKEPDDE